MKNKTITYEQYNKQIKKYNRAVEQGFKPIIKKDWVKISLGVVCLSVAIFPNGLGVLLYPLSFYFLGIGLMDLQELKRKAKNKFKQYTKRG